jgi:hypothetical protein
MAWIVGRIKIEHCEFDTCRLSQPFLKQTSICAVDRMGSVVREGVVDSDPEAISVYVRSKAPGAVWVSTGIEGTNHHRSRGLRRTLEAACQLLGRAKQEVI